MPFTPILGMTPSVRARIANDTIRDNSPPETGPSTMASLEEFENLLSRRYLLDHRGGGDCVPSFRRGFSIPYEVSVYLQQVGRYFNTNRLRTVPLLSVARSAKCTPIEASRARWILLLMYTSLASETAVSCDMPFVGCYAERR